VLLVVLPGMLYVWAGLPSTSNLSTARLPLSTRIYDRTGTVLLAEIHQGSERRHIVPLSQVAPSMQQATVAVEDRTFYQHGGLNLFRKTGPSAVSLRSDPARGSPTGTDGARSVQQPERRRDAPEGRAGRDGEGTRNHRGPGAVGVHPAGHAAKTIDRGRCEGARLRALGGGPAGEDLWSGAAQERGTDRGHLARLEPSVDRRTAGAGKS